MIFPRSKLILVSGKSQIYRETQHPQGVAGLEKVQEVEDILSSKYQRQPSAPEVEFPKPVFIIPLEPEVLLTEGAPLHLEAQVEPRNDPDLKLEWYFNGKALTHGNYTYQYYVKFKEKISNSSLM